MTAEQMRRVASMIGADGTLYVPASVLVEMIERLLVFPYATICRHHVAAELLSELERHGASVSQELAGAVVGADDDEGLRLLPTLGIDYKSKITIDRNQA